MLFFDNISFSEIDNASYGFLGIRELLDQRIPDLDFQFKEKLVADYQLIESILSEIEMTVFVSSKKIINFLDENYKNKNDFEFFDLVVTNQTNLQKIKSLEADLKDMANHKILIQLFDKYYIDFIKQKQKQLTAKTMTVQEMTQFCDLSYFN